MRVAVVGGAGYIGSHVVLALQDAGHTPIIFDNLSLGLEENVDATKAEFFKGDMRDKEDLEVFFDKYEVDAVILLAALKAVGESMEKPGKYMENNISGSINLCNAMLEAGIKTLVFSSSAAVYGEPEYVPIDEKHPLNPMSPYGFTKVKMEEIFSWYTKLKGLKVANLRYFNAVGYDANGRITGREKDPQNLFPRIFETAIEERPEIVIFGDDFDTDDGTCVRDYIHVTDLADAHVKSLDYLENKEEITINLATGKGLSVKECVDAVKKEMGDFKVTIGSRRAGDPGVVLASADKAEKLLDWKCKHSDIDNIVKTMAPVYKK